MKIKQYYKSLDDKLKKALEPYNLKKKYPDYFNVWVFRSFFILLLLLGVVDFALNDFTFFGNTLSCPENSLQPCINPFYICPFVANQYNYNFKENNCLQATEDNINFVKNYGLPYTRQFIEPGEFYGRRDILAQHPYLIAFLLIVGAFVTNDIIYKIKNRYWGIHK